VSIVRAIGPWLALTGVAIASSFLASWGLARLVAPPGPVPPIETAPAPAEPRDLASARPDTGPGPAEIPSKQEYLHRILERNIFDHAAAGEHRTASGSGGEEPSDLDLILIATVVAQPSRYSSALIALDTRDAEALGYGLGDRVLGAEVVRIERERVYLRREDGSVEFIEIRDEVRGLGSTSPGQRTRPSEAVVQVDEREFLIDRGLVDKYLGDLSAIQRLGRARLHRRGGEVDGYRLTRIRRNSIGYQLGLRSRDVVHAINGHSLTSMNEAMAAYQDLQHESSFTIELTRKGERIAIDYTLQ